MCGAVGAVQLCDSHVMCGALTAETQLLSVYADWRAAGLEESLRRKDAIIRVRNAQVRIKSLPSLACTSSTGTHVTALVQC